MSTITDFHVQADLALAAYANLTSGISSTAYTNALTDDAAGMTLAQATVFAAKWNVITQYTDPLTGVSATVFQAVSGGPKYLAIRGTQGLTDYLADYLILNGTPSTLNPQYQSLKTQVQAWLGNGTLSPGFTVSGHSLGGYLAAGLVADFGSSISRAYLYNAPGNNSLVSQIAQALGFSGMPDASKITSLRADAGISPISGLGNDFAPPISIAIENQFLSDVSNPPGSYNHSQRVLTDSLALYAACAQLDPTANVSTITNIIKASSNLNVNTLETALDNVRELIFGATTPGTVPEDREGYYTNLKQLTDWLAARPNTAPALKLDALTTYGGTAIAAKAQANTPDGLAYRYALANLNPFAVTGDASIYASHNTAGELNRYDPAIGTGTLSDLYLQDRAAMLSWKMKFDTGAPDSDDPLTPRADKPYSEEWDSWTIKGDWDFIDKTTGAKLVIDGVDLTTTVNHQIVFGTSQNDTLTGDKLADHLYGMAGADILAGNNGNDYLEGGAGFDTYVINPGDGYDTVLDSDGTGVVKFGTVEAKGSAGLDPTKWIKLSDDSWADTQNGIVYRRSVVDGETRLLVKKGDSSALVKGWADGDLGITLSAGAPLAPPPTLLTGTATGNYLNDPGTGSRKVEGQAGKDMLWGAAAADQLYGGDGGDWIMGNLGADYIEGGLGNDYITGLGEGADVKGGDGNDIVTAASAEYLTIDGPRTGAIPGITADIIWTDVSQHWTAAYNLQQLNPDGSLDFQYGGGVAINTVFSGASALGGGWAYQFSVVGGVFQIKYTHPTMAPNGEAPATSFYHEIDSGYVLAGGVYLSGEAGDDFLVGNNGDDVLDGGTGDDILVGEDGHDILLGGDQNDSLFGEAGNDVLDGGAGADELYGGLGEDILDGGAGADTLVGGAGNDTYLNVTGDDVIDDTEGHDTIVLAAATGLGTGGLSVVNTGDQGQYRQLNVALDNGETLKLDDAFFGSSAAIQFANGDELDLETLVGTRLATSLYLGLDDAGGKLYGGAAADILNGGFGDDILTGHWGNDMLQGGYGNDVYLVSMGDGQDTIFEVGGDADTLRFDERFRPEDIKLTRWYAWDYSGRVEDSLRLEWLNTDGPSPKTEYVHIKNYFESVDGSRRVDRIEFADNTVWTYADIQARFLAPTNGGDTLNGFAGMDAIDGLDGHDSINGKAGNDILQGGSGDDDLQGGLGNDTLLGGSGNDRLLGYAAWLDDTSAANNDPGDDVLWGGAGNDFMFGGQGNDTYLFGRGDGYDEIGEIPNASGTSTDVLRLGAGVLPEDVTLYRVLSPGSGGTDGDLLVVLDGSPTQILIGGYFSSEDRQIERIEFDGGAGAVWVAADINALVDAGTQNSMVGTSADDVFVVDHEFDSISESLNGGTDTIIASRTFWQLPANVENLTLTGFLNIGAYGNGLNNILNGNSGSNFIFGNGGYDIAYGGAGDDIYKDVDQIIELADEGVDTLLSIGGTLPDNVENMYMGKYGLQVQFSGYGSYDFDTLLPGGSPGIAIGNDLANILVSPGDGRQTQPGLYVLDGRAGADTMVVHAADKVAVYIDNPGDHILGTPYEIRSSINYTLPENASTPVYSSGTYAGNVASSTPTARLVLVGNDAIDGVGNAFNNMLDGTQNTAVNTLTGGKGDDYYRLGMDDVAVELVNEGYDTVEIYSVANASLPSIFYDMTGKNIEKVMLTGYQPGTVIGGVLDDYIVGNDASNDLRGDAGNDTLEGRGGKDTLTGGDGADLYYADASDVILEEVGGGYDTTIFSANPYGSFLHNVMAENVEEARSNGSAVNIFGNSAANRIVGDSWDNRLSGGDGSDVLKGSYGNDTLFGDSGNDRLDGGDGIDSMAGGAGNDAYVVDNSADIVSENLDEGWDVVESTIIYTLGSNVENLTLTGIAVIDGTGNELANVLRGNSAVNTLNGLDGNDTIYAGDVDSAHGGNGNDTLISENIGSWSYLWGEAGDDILVGGSYSGMFAGGLGNDIITGGVGMNFIWGDDQDMTGGGAGGNDTITGGNGYDYVIAGQGDDVVYGNGGNDNLSGNQGNDRLYGGVGDDSLMGGPGNDFLDGGSGADTMNGGTSDDIYIVDNLGDIVTENAGEGIDTVESRVTYTLGSNVENLTLTGTAAINGTGNELNNSLIGNSASNTLSGGVGNDTLDGGAGADFMIGGVGDDYYVIDNAGDIVIDNAGEGTADSVELHLDADYTLGVEIERSYRYGSGNWTTTGNSADNYLYGGMGNDTLIGLAGNDLLWGDAGTDTLIGGAGNDRYYVESAGDVAVENANEGVDTVYVFGSASYILAANVENGYRTFWEGSLTGNELNNSLNGSWGVDVLDGGVGADTLIGYGGNDTLGGGTGNDTYIMGRGYAADTVIENDATAGNTDVAQFLTGVSADHIWFQKIGNNLETSIIGTSDKLVIKDWYLGSANHVEQFKTTDGAKTLIDSNVQNLVNAMASFAPPAAGQTTLPQTYQDALAGVIAANWQ